LLPATFRADPTISENLHIPFGVAVEFALIHGLASSARGVLFFRDRIEASPGNRLASDDVWAAFQEWGHSRKFKADISAKRFTYLGHDICDLKNILVRVRGSQVVLVDVRLRPADILKENAA